MAPKRCFNKHIRTLLALPHIDYVGEISDREKPEFLSGAVALLALIDWPEPFGLVTIEAMACGTPSIALDRCAVSEIVEDGLTGFIVVDEVEAINALKKIDQLSRAKIRRRFEERFIARRMADQYLVVYQDLIDAARPRPGLRSAS
jgi:glycosyltransferase involved in cell wall biosynthesis